MKNMPLSLAEVTASTLRDKNMKTEIKGKDTNGSNKIYKIKDLYNEFKLSGALTGYVQNQNLDLMKKNIEKELNRATGKTGIIRRGTQLVGRGLNNMAKISETTTRFAVYMSYRTRGKSIAESARAAKEIDCHTTFKCKIFGNKLFFIQELQYLTQTRIKPVSFAMTFKFFFRIVIVIQIHSIRENSWIILANKPCHSVKNRVIRG
jgi:hypothetical protein